MRCYRLTTVRMGLTVKASSKVAASERGVQELIDDASIIGHGKPKIRIPQR